MPRCYETILYHATSQDNIASIMREGLRPTYLGNSIICMSPTLKAAKNFGEVVIKVDVTGYKLSAFEDCLEWERFCWTKKPISPEKLSLIRGGK